MWETSRNKLKKHSVTKIVSTFHCLNKLFNWSQKCCKFLAFRLEFHFFFWQYVWTIFVTKYQFLSILFFSVNQRKSPCPPSWRTYQQTHLGSRVRHIRQSSHGLWNLSKRSSWTLRHHNWRHWKGKSPKRCRK